ncbi:MAG: polysaccharide deacetylase, partial [Leptolyngbya sp. SIO1D8]|nr:polysaccharide deacetylase [Leptolyngbya sp. SIO1D8]
MDKPSKKTGPEAQNLRLLGQLVFFCFGLGAITSSLFAFNIRMPLNWEMAASATPKVASVGLIANQSSLQGFSAFPRQISASYLCLPRTDTHNGTSAALPVAQSENPGLITPVLQGLQKSVGPALLEPLGATAWPNLHEMARSARVPILMYHDVLEEKEVFFDVTVEEMEEHFARIEEENLTPITFDQLIHHLRTGSSLPPKPVLLTFDDGYEGHYT